MKIKILLRPVAMISTISLMLAQSLPALALGEITVETNISPVEQVPVTNVSTPSTQVTSSEPVVTVPVNSSNDNSGQTTVGGETNATVSAGSSGASGSVSLPITQLGDTTPPNINAVAAISILPSEENITWTTDELATSYLEYGTTSNYGSRVTLSAAAGLAHLAVLTGLTPSTRYFYCIHSVDLSENISNSCGHEFTTADLPLGQVNQTVNQTGSENNVGGNSNIINTNLEAVVDTTPPDISLVTVTSLATDRATINWLTGEVANTEVEYGTTAGYGHVTSLDTNLSLAHSATIIGLAPNTEYHYRVRSSDEIGNTSVGPDNIFTTASVSGQTSVTAPEINVTTEVAGNSVVANANLIISGVETESVSDSNVTIAWSTDLPSDSQIEYGETQDLGTVTTIDSSLTTSHSITISNLLPNTNYIFRVKSKPSGTSVAIASELYEFTTLSHATPVIVPANVSNVASTNISASNATISWTTDKGANSQVEYGISTSYGETSAPNSSYVTDHSVTLDSLDPLTTYHYRVKSIDSANNITFSVDHTFTTLNISPDQSGSNNGVSNGGGNVVLSVPEAILTLTVGGYDQNSVALTWHVASSSTDISHEYDIRYSTSPITAENYSGAMAAQLTPIYHNDLDPNGIAREYIVAGLSPNTNYYFAIKSKRQSGDWSAISNVVSIKTSAIESSNNSSENSPSNRDNNVISSISSSSQNLETQSELSANSFSVVQTSYGGQGGGSAVSSFEPTAIKVEPADSQIVFEWHNPGEKNFVRTVIVRKEGSYPASPTDGETLYEGRGQTFTDTNVVNGKTYYYSFYSYNHAKIYSSPVRFSLAPKAGNGQLKFNQSGSLAPFFPASHFTKIYKRGDKNIEIEHLQEILYSENVSFPDNLITGYFGSYTENALRQFQKKYGLRVTGIVDVPTQAKLTMISKTETRLAVPGDFAMFDTDLKIGSTGEAVKNLQEFLANEGSYPEAMITGYYGNRTKNAVMIFQKKYSITPVSGYVGYKTRHRMQQLSGF